MLVWSALHVLLSSMVEFLRKVQKWNGDVVFAHEIQSEAGLSVLWVAFALALDKIITTSK